MARYHAAWRPAGAGSVTLPMASLYAVAGVRPRLVEVSVFNTTTTAVEVALQRLTTAGTQGSTITASYEDDENQTALATAKDTHTVAPTLGGRVRLQPLGAAIGSGIVWTFGGVHDAGLAIPAGTANGIGLILASGTAQQCEVNFTWDE